MTNVIASYSSKATAVRGAKRAGIENPIAYESDGRWFIELKVIANVLDTQPATVTLNALFNLDLPTPAPLTLDALEQELTDATVAKLVPTRDKGSSYKALAELAPSRSEFGNPVAVIWATISAHPELARKDMVALLVKMGANIHTARTQFQRHKAAGGVFTGRTSPKAVGAL